MNRSEINAAHRAALACFARHHWTLPPHPRWDITDFGLGNFTRYGLTLVNLATEPEYCEKLMHARRGQTTPCHSHVRKKEDIICRAGELSLRLWPSRPGTPDVDPARPEMVVSVDGQVAAWPVAEPRRLPAGSRVTIPPGVWHEFQPASDECIIGEVSTGNDDRRDNLFLNAAIGRFPEIGEDEPARVRLISE